MGNQFQHICMYACLGLGLSLGLGWGGLGLNYNTA